MTDHVQAKLQRHTRVFDGAKSDRTQTLFQFFLPQTAETPVRPELRPENKQLRIDWAKRRYEYEMKISRVLDDDSIPCLDVVSSTAIFPHAFGAPVFYPVGNNPCGMPLIETAEEVSKITVPKLEDSTLMYYFDMADELKRFGGPDAILRVPDIQDPIGVAAIMWNKTKMMYAMIEEPEAIHELTEKIYQLETAFLDEWFRRYGKRFSAHYPYYVMNTGISISVDEVGNISPSMFDEFIKEPLNRLSARYGGLGIHCCARSEHQFENFSKLDNLRLINLYRPDDLRRQAYGIFKDVCVQCHGDFVNGIPTYIGPEKEGMVPDGARVIYREIAASLSDAQRKCDEYSKLYR